MSEIKINLPINSFKRWDDLRFPSQGINPPGAASDPVRSTTTGLLEFSGSTDNVICGIAQMPHSWARGSTIYPHLHLRFLTSSATNSRWKLEYHIADNITPFTNSYGIYTDGGTITIANPQNVNKEVLQGFNPIVMAGLKESAVVVWKITRLANSDAADNYTGIVVLLEFDIHFQADKMGTVSEIPD